MSLGKKLFIGSSAAGACSTDSVQPFGAESAYSSNVALYQLDGNANDTVGNYNGTATNVTYSTGKYGNAANFSGTNYITVTGITSTSTFSYSLWVKPTNASSSGFKGVFGKQNTEGQLFTDSGALKIWTTTTQTFTGSPTLSDNVWSHIVLSVSNGTGTIYVNGIDKGTATGISLPSTLYMGTASTQIGNSTYGYQGLIDQVRIYDKALSSDEVGVLYNETTSTASDTNVLGEGSGVALYSLDYDASDAGGNHDGTSTDVNFGVDGQINYGASFNGSSSNITSSASIISGNQARSISAWYKTTTSNTTLIRFGAISANEDWTVNITDASTLDIFGHLSANDESFTSVTPDLLSGDWIHMVVTYDGNTGGTLKLYIDGNLEGTINRGAGEVYNTASGMVIGERAGIRNFNGTIDQVRVFNKALSSSEVSTLYAETACVYTSTTDNNDYPVTNAAYYKLDNNAEDAKGSYNGAESNITYEFGRFGQAAVFNGSSSSIDVGLDIHNNSVNGLTYSFWAYWGNSTFGNAISGGSTNGISGKKSNRQSVVLNKNSERFDYLSREGVYCRHTASLSDGWHHFAVTDNSAGGTAAVKMYIDGQDVSFSSPTASTGYSTNTDLQIGRGINNSGGWAYFDGSLDQVRIYNSALDATAVENLYNEKPEVNTSNFETVLYNGTSSDRYVSTVGFQPDLVWIKRRNSTNAAVIQDSVRGENNYLMPSSANAQASNASFDSFEANGFELTASGGSWNNSAGTYVAWCWKGGGNAVNNTDGNITSQVSANQDAGFSIVKYTGSGSAMTIGHGLSSAPELIIFKSTNTTQDWLIATTVIDGSLDYFWDATAGFGTGTKSDLPWSVPDSSVINFGSSSDVINNLSGTQQMIAYCFHSVAGYQKVGSYSMTSNVNVTVDVGFAPRFVLLKEATRAAGWIMVDNQRNLSGNYKARLYAHSSNIESSGQQIQFIGNTFKINWGSTGNNDNGGTGIYLAIA